MLRNKSILTSISLLLFIAMTMADTKSFYLEQEELVEISEIELEELKEGREGRHWIRLLLSGSTGYLATQNTFLTHRTFRFGLRTIVQLVISIQSTDTPLFIKYCCLKIHLS